MKQGVNLAVLAPQVSRKNSSSVTEHNRPTQTATSKPVSTLKPKTPTVLPLTDLGHFLRSSDFAVAHDDNRPHLVAKFSDTFATLSLTDTGASVNLMSAPLFTLISYMAPHAVMSKVMPTHESIVGAGGDCSISGKVKLAFKTSVPSHDRHVFAQWFYLCPQLCGNMLLGMPAINVMYGENTIHDLFGASDLTNFQNMLIAPDWKVNLPLEYTEQHIIEDGRLKPVPPMPPEFLGNYVMGYHQSDGTIQPPTNFSPDSQDQMTPPGGNYEDSDGEDQAEAGPPVPQQQDPLAQQPVDPMQEMEDDWFSDVNEVQREALNIAGLQGRQELKPGETLNARLKLPQSLQKNYDTFEPFLSKALTNLKISCAQSEVSIVPNQKVLRLTLTNNSNDKISLNRGRPICSLWPKKLRRQKREEQKNEDDLPDDMRPEIGLGPSFQHEVHKLLDNIGHAVWARNEYDIGCIKTSFQAEIKMRTEEPIYVKQREPALKHKEFLCKYVEELLKRNIIEKTNSPYNTQIFAVPKGQKPEADGSFKPLVQARELRAVLNFIPINKNSYDSKYPVKDVRACLRDIGNRKSKFFSVLDVRAAFLHVPLHPKSRKYTAFQHPWKRLLSIHKSPNGNQAIPFCMVQSSR